MAQGVVSLSLLLLRFVLGLLHHQRRGSKRQRGRSKRQHGPGRAKGWRGASSWGTEATEGRGACGRGGTEGQRSGCGACSGRRAEGQSCGRSCSGRSCRRARSRGGHACGLQRRGLSGGRHQRSRVGSVEIEGWVEVGSTKTQQTRITRQHGGRLSSFPLLSLPRVCPVIANGRLAFLWRACVICASFYLPSSGAPCSSLPRVSAALRVQTCS